MTGGYPAQPMVLAESSDHQHRLGAPGTEGRLPRPHSSEATSLEFCLPRGPRC